MSNLQSFKCKNCGALFQAATNENGVLKCEYCDSIFTIPKKDSNNEVLQFLQIGEHNLDACHFDEAYTAFEKASQLNDKEPETYWGMALAEFKVQYIKDAVNNRLQPICHEFNDKEFQANKNYLKALKCAGAEQKSEYFSKAQDIDYIREEFLKLQQSGLDYDCFICVKVSQTGVEQADISKKNWTNDAYNADSIYDLLKRHDFRPFFSEREIKGRNGANYEAMILYALYTAETMLVVCSDEEYLRTPWVKNEYTRFKSLIKNEEKENDSLTIVYNGKPIDRLPGDNNGRIQGIDYSRREADFEIVKFVENHTPLARAKREEETHRKQEEELRRAQETLDLKRQLDEMKYLVQNKDLTTDIAKNKRQYKTILDDFEIESNVILKYKGDKQQVEIPEGITTIGAKAFADSITLNIVKIPNTVKNIDHQAFYNCYGLLVVMLPYSIMQIGSYAFAGCRVLTKIEIPNSVVSIGDGAFEFCARFKSVVVPESVKSIGAKAFSRCSHLSNIVIQNGVESIGTAAFYGCESLECVTIPQSVKSIGAAAFSHCSHLSEIDLPKGLKTIAHDLFADCNICLCEVIIPYGVTIIEYNAFSKCELLFKVEIPESVMIIEYNAFKNCTNLKEIHIPQGIKSINYGTFYKCTSLKVVNIPSSVDTICHEAFFGCKSLAELKISNGVMAIEEGAFAGCKSLVDIYIPSSVMVIEESAFEQCISLRNVTMPKRFKKQRRKIFKHCSLRKIKFTYTK